MREGNYLAFAVACRWISKITFVTPQKWKEDFLPIHFQNNDPSSNYLQLKKYDSKVFDDYDVYEKICRVCHLLNWHSKG
jgi:hypothetical protein